MPTITYTVLLTITDSQPPSADTVARAIGELFENQRAMASAQVDAFTGDLLPYKLATAPVSKFHADLRENT